MTTFDLGGGVVVHHIVDPEHELLVPLGDDQLASIESHKDEVTPWALSKAGEARITTAAICVESGDSKFVIDPFSAFAELDRSSPEAASEATRRVGLLTEAGFGPADVDVVILTHVDGSGALSVPVGGVEQAVFDQTPHLMTAAAAETARTRSPAGVEAFTALEHADLIRTVGSDHSVDGSVRFVDLPSHESGHVGVHIQGADDEALAVGHLFLHPTVVYALDSSLGDRFPERLESDRRMALELVGAGLLIGDLFCDPGAIRVTRDGNDWSLTPAS
jgi:hypothetical protein